MHVDTVDGDVHHGGFLGARGCRALGHGPLAQRWACCRGRAWFAGNDPCRLIMVDTKTKQLVTDDIELPGCGMPVGVSIDVEGYVWVVDQQSSLAYKVDPTSYDIVLTVTGLVNPYTYSDMTGAGLGLISNPPQG